MAPATDSPARDRTGDEFDQPRPVLIATADERLAATLLAALDQLTWPHLRASSLHEAATLCATHAFELLLVDVRLGADGGSWAPGEPAPAELRGALNPETPWLPVAPGEHRMRADAILCYEGGIASAAIAEFIGGELDRIAEARILSAARLLVAAPDGRSAVAIPPALEAAQRLEWMYTREPSIESAAAIVERQEHLGKQVIRLAHVVSGNTDMRSWQVKRVLLHLGLLHFIPLVKMVGARWMFPVRAPGRQQSLDAIWRHSLGRAIAMRWLAPRIDVSASAAFDAGLFADAGAGLLLWLQDQSEPRALRSRPAGPLSQVQAAQHEWLGEKLLESWQQRKAVAQVARVHHTGLIGPTPPGLATLSLAAAAVVGDAGLGPDPTGTVGDKVMGHALDQLNLTAGNRAHVEALVRMEVERIDEAFAR